MPYFVLEIKFTCHRGHENVQHRYYESKNADDIDAKTRRWLPKTFVCSECPPETPLRGKMKAYGNLYALTDEEFEQLEVVAEPDTPVM